MRANLRQGDIITAFDGRPITSPQLFALAVGEKSRGMAATLSVWRGGKDLRIDVTLGEQRPVTPKVIPVKELQSRALGLTLEPLSSVVWNEIGSAALRSGAYVVSVRPASPADQSGLQKGDVILGVGGEAIGMPSDVANSLQRAEHDKVTVVPVLVARGGSDYYVALQLGS